MAKATIDKEMQVKGLIKSAGDLTDKFWGMPFDDTDHGKWLKDSEIEQGRLILRTLTGIECKKPFAFEAMGSLGEVISIQLGYAVCPSCLQKHTKRSQIRTESDGFYHLTCLSIVEAGGAA